MSHRRVIIVGSGVAAVTVARRLLNLDPEVEVLIMEAGGDLRMANRRIWLDFLMTKKRPQDRFIDLVADYEINANGVFVLEGSRLLVRGGSTNHWGGWALRMKPEDFELRSRAAKAIDWPISYTDLLPWYAEAESALEVAGDSSSINPPRAGATFPFPPVPYTILDGPVTQALDALSYSHEYLPLARNAYRCQTTGTCRYCPFDARYAAGSDLDRLVADPAFSARLSVRTGVPVRRAVMHDQKHCAGVEYIDAATGKTKTEEGDLVIIAAGTIESAKVLLASAGKFAPNGVGNHAGHLGRYLITHPLLSVVGTLKSNPQHMEQEIDFPTLACRHFDSPTEQATGKMFFVRDGKYVQLAIENEFLKKRSPAEIDKLIENSTRLELRALVEGFPDGGNSVSLAKGDTRFGLPRSKIEYKEETVTAAARKAHEARLVKILEGSGCRDIKVESPVGARGDHASGTCRMSKSAAEGVVDQNLRIHDVENMFVCSNAVFPNTGAVNPTLTLTALALRLGSHIATA